MMLDTWIERARHTQHGFTDIKSMAEEIKAEHTADERNAIAHQLYASEVAQARMAAVFIWSYEAAANKAILQTLHDTVSRDPDWRVQEILAQAFDRYCADWGYELALPTIAAWLQDEHPNIRRAVSEGLRIWTTRPYFRNHPEVAVALLASLRGDESEYVRKSVGNALRDISRKHAGFVQAEVETWDTSNTRVAQTYQLATKFLK